MKPKMIYIRMARSREEIRLKNSSKTTPLEDIKEGGKNFLDHAKGKIKLKTSTVKGTK